MNDIICSHLYKTYNGIEVLRGFTAVFAGGTGTAVMAPSGAGKTTLLRILAGIEQPDAGSVQGLAGQRISMVFQEDRLCGDLDAESNIRLVTPALPREEVREAMAAAGLSELSETGRPVREFSGGMKRRVAILRAALYPGDVLLLDEPFRGLDEETRARTAEWLQAKWEGRTKILVTHDASEPALLACGDVFHMA